MFSYQRLAIISLLAVAITCSFVHAQEIERIQNGGFENGFEDWTPDPKHELVEGEQPAHTGGACVSGETLAPNQALRLVQEVEVSAGNLYKFSCWARGTNQTKLVLFGTFPGETTRRSITVWDRLPNRWTPCATLINVPADGVLKLELISPSSYGANPGKIWIDDVSLLETVMPNITTISDDATYDDDPVAATANDGSVYIAYNAFHDGADALEIARVKPKGNSSTVDMGMTTARVILPPEKYETLGQWTVPHEPDAAILTPTLVSRGEDVLLLYATEIDDQWVICSVSCNENGPGKVTRLTTSSLAIHPSAAVDNDGLLWVAFETTYCYRRRVAVTAFNAEGESVHRYLLTSALLSAYDPSLVILDSGEVVVAYHGFRDDNYDVYIRRHLPGAEKFEDERRLTFAPSIDRHARLAAHGDDLYIVWENTNCSAYRIGSSTERRLILAKIEADGLLTPGVESPLLSASEKPTLQFDDVGQLWIAYRKPRGRHQAWGSWLTSFDTRSGRFTPPRPVSLRKGMNTPPGLAISNTGCAIVASQWDDTPGHEPTRLDSMDAISNIDVATVGIEIIEERLSLLEYDSPVVAMVPLVESDAPFEAAAIRQEHGEDLETPSIDYEGEELNLYFGDLHEHTDISICNREGDQTLEESYAHMRDIARYDFACITDHGYNMNPYRWHQAAKWARAEYDGSLDRPNARFLTMLGFEWTSTFERYTDDHPHGYYGHRNLILSDMHFPRWWNATDEETPEEVWAELREMEADFVHIPHQLADTGNVPFDHEFHDEASQPVAEIFQTRGSYEYFGAPRMAGRTTGEPGAFMQDAWADGLVIGVIASPDHGGGYGKACVYAENLSREAILDALRARRCYGSTGAKIVLDVRINGNMMGEKIADSPDGPVTVDIKVSAPQPIKEIVVWRSNENVYTCTPGDAPSELTLQYVDEDPIADESYYYVRVILENDEIAWTSPVWFGRE